MSFVDTGCFINATTEEKENMTALSMYYALGKYDPSYKHIQNYRNKNIIKLYKTITESKLIKTSTLFRIYQYLHTINKRIDKNKTNVKTNHKHNTKVNLDKTTSYRGFSRNNRTTYYNTKRKRIT